MSKGGQYLDHKSDTCVHVYLCRESEDSIQLMRGQYQVNIDQLKAMPAACVINCVIGLIIA